MAGMLFFNMLSYFNRYEHDSGIKTSCSAIRLCDFRIVAKKDF